MCNGNVCVTTCPEWTLREVVGRDPDWPPGMTVDTYPDASRCAPDSPALPPTLRTAEVALEPENVSLPRWCRRSGLRFQRPANVGSWPRARFAQRPVCGSETRKSGSSSCGRFGATHRAGMGREPPDTVDDSRSPVDARQLPFDVRGRCWPRTLRRCPLSAANCRHDSPN